MTDPQPNPAAESGTPAQPAKRSSRRRVLKVAAVVAAGAAAGVGAPAVLQRMLNRGQLRRWRFLTEAEASLLDAVCAQIIPTDQDPGAREAGCVRYIDWQLAGPHKRLAGRYHDGLAALVATCQALHQKPFEQLSSDEQVKLLAKLEAGQAPKEHWTKVSSGEFFGLVCDHTMQGFYGSPRHGGNRDYASYRMLGLAYPNIIGQDRHAVAKRS
jgi:gluconate 2-dehydrogenase gamma chain